MMKDQEMATDEQSFSLSLWRTELFTDSDGRLWGLKALCKFHPQCLTHVIFESRSTCFSASKTFRNLSVLMFIMESKLHRGKLHW